MSLDREIEDLLAVDPSPEFVAKVRQRIAHEPAPRAWWFSWQWAAGAASAFAIAATAVWFQSAPASVPVTAPTTVVAIAPTPRPESTPPSAPAVAPRTKPAIAPTAEPAIAPATAPALARSNRIARPVVLIQQEEAEAMRLLLARVREDALPDMTEALAVVDATGPEWIAIPAVTIDPIPSGEGE